MRKIPNKTFLVHKLGLAKGTETKKPDLTFLSLESTLSPQYPFAKYTPSATRPNPMAAPK